MRKYIYGGLLDNLIEIFVIKINEKLLDVSVNKEKILSDIKTRLMYIARIAVAKILNTKPSNIRHTKRIEDKIQVKLWDSKDLEFITIDEYQKCFQEIRKGKSNNDGLSFGSILVAVGIITLLGGYSMNTTVSSYGDEYHNIGLMHERSSTIQLGGIVLITGTVMCCLKKK